MLPEELLDMLGLSNEPDLPDNVRLEILKEIFDQIQTMKNCHDELTGNRNQNNDGEEDADNNNIDGDDSDEDEEDDRDYFTMNDSCWDAVKTAVANKIALKREANTKELELPSDESANICRYNPKAHYRFASEAANSSVDTLLDSLVQCKLRTRPTNYSKNAPEYERLPFVLRTYDNSGFDLDGDIVAMCGDECFNNMRASKNFVGYQRVPVPVNLEDAKTVCALRDSKDTDLPWDRNICNRVFKDGKGKKEWFSSCMADSQNNLIWAADTRSMKIHAFSTKSTDYGNDDSDSEGEKEKKRAAICDAKLSFASPEVKAQSAWVNGSVGLTKCKDTIISSAGTGRLSAWKIKSALEDNTKTVDPSIMLVDDNKNFLCGDIQYVGGSNLIVAPLRFEFNESKHSTTIRLYDVEVESVAGLFCGTLGEVSVGKQYCVESHSSIFAMSNNAGVVFDTRTYQPTIALHVEKRRSNQILGVPTSSTPVAFTYGSNEEIKCWDLRNPGSHVYTMSTGNTTVNCLLWHEDSSSLLASTESKHIITHGYHAGYMYGNKLSMDEEEELENEEWPRGAVHGPSYFGSPWNVDCNYSFALLQYSFQNGRKMHERPARLKSET